jgi:hypothetical protein
MKYSKNCLRLLPLLVFFLLVSCKTTVVTPEKPLYDNTLELYKTYTVQTNDAKVQKLKVLKVDSAKIYGETKAGEKIEIERSDVREIKKPNVLGSVIIGLVAVAAVVFIPI